MRVAFFTAGTHGAGHLARGVAIGRALVRAGFHGRYRMFGPTLPFHAAHRPDWEPITITEDDLRTEASAKATLLATALTAFAPDVLLVDMFWAPLRYILPLPGCESWLLLRSFPPTWLVGPPGFPFEASLFTRIIAIEPVADPRITVAIDPVVMVNPDEQKERGALRSRLGVPRDKRLVAVAHGGLEGEHRLLAPMPGPNEVLFTFDIFEREATFPIAEWLGDCDEIHCAAGYNSFWEAKWLGYAPRTRFTPFIRRNDDQRWRITRGAEVTMRANGADTLAAWLTAKATCPA